MVKVFWDGININHLNVSFFLLYRVSQKKCCLLKMLTEENLLAIDCKHVLQAVSVLTSGSFTWHYYNFTIVSFLDISKRLFNVVFESIYDYFLSQ